MQPSVSGADTPRLDSLDTLRHELRVGLLDRPVEVGGDDETLAGGPVVGTETLAQLAVPHVLLEVGPARRMGVCTI